MKKSSKRKGSFFLAMALTFLVCQVVWAERSWVCELTVTGTICAIIEKDADEPEDANVIVLSDSYDCSIADSEVTVYGIPFNKLNKYLEGEELSPLAEGDTIGIQAHVCPAEDGQLKACKILSINDKRIDFTLRPGNEKSKGKNK